MNVPGTKKPRRGKGIFKAPSYLIPGLFLCPNFFAQETMPRSPLGGKVFFLKKNIDDFFIFFWFVTDFRFVSI